METNHSSPMKVFSGSNQYNDFCIMDRIELNCIVNDIKKEVEERFGRLGLYYRVFARGKTSASIKHKLSMKQYGKDKKIQDIIGIRIVLYFLDDVKVVYDILKASPNYLSESNSEKDIKQLDNETKLSIGGLSDKLFMPQRLNLVFKMNKTQTESLNMALEEYENNHLIDNTYEVQIRTIFSEGWHEVEHDIRYKCNKDAMWDYCTEESRTLNGMYASLETTEYAMRSLFDSIAYKNFKHNDWSAMLRNKMCIRFEDDALSAAVCNSLATNDCILGKEIYKFKRSSLFILLKKLPSKLPRKMDNIVFLINRATLNREDVVALEPTPISDLFKKVPSFDID